MPGNLPKELCRRWLHSHEEDTGKELVYRPAGYKFPRSRGRTGFELKSDGTCEYVGIGRTDQPDTVRGTWSLETGPRPAISLRLDSGETLTLLVASLSRDRLVIARP